MKIKSKKATKISLSDKIADALTLKPRADIEDDQVFGTKPQTVSRTDFSSSGSEDEAVISDFRKRNVNLLSDISKKYEGKVVSRKRMRGESEGSDNESSSNDQSEVNYQKNNGSSQEKSDSDDSNGFSKSKQRATVSKNKKEMLNSEDSESEDGESDDYSITKFQNDIKSDEESGGEDKSGEDGSEEDGSDEDEGNDADDDDDTEGFDISQMEEPVKENFEHIKKQNIPEEVKKGNCVRNQLLIWEGLLEMRIHLQKCLNTANQMPLPETFRDLKENKDFEEKCNETKLNVSNVLEKFLSLQNMLLKNFPETKSLSINKKGKLQEPTKKPEESDEEIPSDTEDEEIPSDTEPEASDNETTHTKEKQNPNQSKKRKLDDFEKEIDTSHKAFKTFRDSTIQKWNEKTRLATATNIKSTPTNTVLQQISYILSDKHKLVKRTQLKRSEYEIVGYKSNSEPQENKDKNGVEENSILRDRKYNDEYIPDIFDDSDFYHQLLRELIECKSADISDPVQLSRQWIALQQMRSKMKRKVDTKATKGRKIKYVVHNKLVNYMASEKSTTWTDESTNELYSSLFGKMFEQNNIGINVENGFKITN